MSEEHPIPEASFSVFNMNANRKMYKEFVSQIEKDRFYIAELEKILKSHGIEVPKDILGDIIHKRDPADRIMKDGSLTALASSLSRIEDHNKMHEVNIQFRDLTFWNNLPAKTIPTVGSAVKKFFLGDGTKHRVDIIKGLTGRILPKTMTLLMGPPGCGENVICVV